MKKILLFIMMLVIVTSSILGCGSSANKEGTLGSPRNEIEKVYGTGQNIKRGIVYPDRIVGFNQVGLTRSVSDKKSDIEKKDSPIYKFLPADAKEVELSKSEMPKYLKGKHKFFYSKSLADQIANSKEDGKTLKFNIAMSYTPEGEAFMEWWYDNNEMLKLFEKKAKENNISEKQNKNNATNSNTANSNKSNSNLFSFFSSTESVTAEQLMDGVKIDKLDSPLLNKKVKLTSVVQKKYMDKGVPTLIVYYYDGASKENNWSDLQLYKQAKEKGNYFKDYIFVQTDVKTFNRINNGIGITVTGTVAEARPYNTRMEKWRWFDDDKLMPWADGRIVIIKASNLEF